MKQKTDLGHERVVLLRTCLNRDLSENTVLKISQVIRNTRLKESSEASDEKAREITEIINKFSCLNCLEIH